MSYRRTGAYKAVRTLQCFVRSAPCWGLKASRRKRFAGIRLSSPKPYTLKTESEQFNTNPQGSSAKNTVMFTPRPTSND